MSKLVVVKILAVELDNSMFEESLVKALENFAPVDRLVVEHFLCSKMIYIKDFYDSK